MVDYGLGGFFRPEKELSYFEEMASFQLRPDTQAGLKLGVYPTIGLHDLSRYEECESDMGMRGSSSDPKVSLTEEGSINLRFSLKQVDDGFFLSCFSQPTRYVRIELLDEYGRVVGYHDFPWMHGESGTFSVQVLLGDFDQDWDCQANDYAIVIYRDGVFYGGRTLYNQDVPNFPLPSEETSQPLDSHSLSFPKQSINDATE